MLELNSEFLCELVGDLGEFQPIGATPHGTRIIAPIIGGTMKGPKLNGNVLAFGADWLLFRSDGVGEVDVRATVQTDDGALIYGHYRGILKIDPQIMARIQNGEDIDPSSYYFRTTPVLETGSEKYNWLNQIVCVGVGKVEQNRVRYKVYQIL